MSPEARLKRSRNSWKHKAGERGQKLRYLRKELIRVKEERDLLKKELKETESRLCQVSGSPGFVVEHKVDLVFLALQLFVMARIGFRAVSRVLGVVMGALGIKKSPLSTDHHQLGDQAFSSSHPVCSDAPRAPDVKGSVF
jgi:hypothetical protein